MASSTDRQAGGRAATRDPLFVAIAATIERQIASGEIGRGARLVSERALCERFGVSRVTIRAALAELRDRGLVEPDGTRGWFVTSSLGEPSRLVGFSEMARARGLVPSSIVLGSETRAATLDEAEELGIAPGAPLFHLARIRLLDGTAVGHERTRIPVQRVPGIADHDYAHTSLYEVMRKAGVAPWSADYVVQACAAAPPESEWLGLPIGSPVLLTTAVTSTLEGRKIELSRSIFRGDRYRFRTTLSVLRER